MQAQGYAVGRGTTTIDDSSSLTVPSESVDFEDSCIMGTAEADLLKLRCTAERDTFRPGGVLDVTQQSLVIDPSEEYADEEVVLANTNPPQQPLVVPQVLIWTPIGQLVWLVLVLVALLGCVSAATGSRPGARSPSSCPARRVRSSPTTRSRRGTGPPAGASAGLPGWPIERSDCSTSSVWSRSPWAC